MNETNSERLTEPCWLTYLRATIFVGPAIVAWGFACTFLVPKAREIANDVSLDTSRFGGLWYATMFLVYRGGSILVVGILAFVLLEFFLPGWRQRRQLELQTTVWIANVAVFLGLAMLLLMVLIAAPALAHVQ